MPVLGRTADRTPTGLIAIPQAWHFLSTFFLTGIPLLLISLDSHLVADGRDLHPLYHLADPAHLRSRLNRPLAHARANHPNPATMATPTDAPSPKVFGIARRTLGIALLLVVVFLWTASNFLGSVRTPAPAPSLYNE